MRECTECGIVHGPGHCPECRACDFTPNSAGVRECWNCGAIR